jgi:uncharacterized protein
MNGKLLFFIMVFATCVFSQNQINPAKKARIENLLEVTGSLKIGATFGKAIVKQMYEAYQKTGTSLPDSVVIIMEKEINGIMDDEMKIKSGLVDQLCSVYDKYYTDKNLDDLLQFYNSETGRKVIATLPNVMQESMEIGQQWGAQKGAEVAQKLLEKLQKKGIKLPKI